MVKRGGGELKLHTHEGGKGFDGIGEYCQVYGDEWKIIRTLCTRLKFKWRDVEMAVIRLSESVIFYCYVEKVAAKVLIRRRI